MIIGNKALVQNLQNSISTDIVLGISLTEFEKKKKRTKGFAEYIDKNHNSMDSETYGLFFSGPDQRIKMLSECRDHFFIGASDAEGYELISTNTCKQSFLCPMCASVRATKSARQYFKKYLKLKDKHPKARLYYIVFTIRNRENLLEGFELLKASIQRTVKYGREAKSSRKSNSKKLKYALAKPLSNVIAGAYSYEFKRGRSSKQWHPHVNMVILTDKPINYKKLRKEWNRLTKEKSNAHCTLIEKDNEEKSFFEIFKYALKFSDMTYDDNLYVFKSMRGKRLVGSFGEFRGIKIKKDKKQTVKFIDNYIYTFENGEYILKQI